MRLVLVCLLVAGCAADIRTHFPVIPNAPTGTLVLLMGDAASSVSVAINGLLVVENAHTAHIVIDGVPIGTADVVVAANGVDKEFHTWVGGDHATTVPLGVPDASSSFLKALFGTLVTLVVYSLIH